jgi:hypothetical protein
MRVSTLDKEDVVAMYMNMIMDSIRLRSNGTKSSMKLVMFKYLKAIRTDLLGGDR